MNGEAGLRRCERESGLQGDTFFDVACAGPRAGRVSFTCRVSLYTGLEKRHYRNSYFALGYAGWGVCLRGGLAGFLRVFTVG